MKAAGTASTAGQNRILEMIAAGAPLGDALRAIVELIEADAPEMLASIVLLDEDGIHLRHGAASRLPQAYCRAIDGQPIGPRAGSCGTAMHRAEPVIAKDIDSDPLWADYRGLAKAHGLRASWSTPIFDTQRRVLGSFALYFRQPGPPQARHQRLIGMATHLAAIAIARQRAEGERERLVRELVERVKELTAMHDAARLLQKPRAVDAALLAEFAAILPPAWQFPEVCEARITYGEMSAQTGRWRASPWTLSAAFSTVDGRAGAIQVAYLEQRPAAAEGPFLADERRLIDALADMLAAHLERGRLMREVSENEGMFRSIFEKAAVGITLTDMQGRLLQCNPALARMLGCEPAELVGRPFAEITHADDAAENQRLYRSLVAGEIGHFRMEKRYLRKDGGVVWVQLNVSRIEAEGGAAPFTIGMMEDISARKRAEAAVLESEKRFRALAEGSPDAILIHQDRQIIFVNRAMVELMRARDAGDLLGKPATFMLTEAFAETARQRIEALYAGEPRPRAEQVYLRLDGTPVDVEIAAAPIVMDGRPAAQVTVRDITSRKHAELGLRESERRFRGILEGMTVGFLSIDRDWKLTYVNPRAAEIVGRSAESLIGRKYVDAFPEAEGSPFELAYRKVMAERVTLQHADYFAPWQRWFEQRIDPTPDGISVFFQDVTERKQYESRIEYLATHDGLTDLPNRNLIHDRITQAISHARRTERQIAVLYLDLDRFKVINDGFGHPFGDAVLKAAGERLAGIVREGDTVARQSGDEFLILLADLRRSTDVYIVAQKILEAFGQPLLLQGREVHLSFSIGVSLFPQDGQTADALIGNADVAMYRAKDAGRNAYQFFTREMSDETQRRVEIETELRSAVSRGQLQLAYQPKVDLATGRITGCEALLRWVHPSLGPVSPARFIPVAEESGLIVPIGDWVLRTACAQARAWQEAGLPPVTVAVNLSARQFLQQDVVAWVTEVLRATGLPPGQLELELTESLIAQDVEKVIATVNRLKDAGVRMAIDDFGTGYSSLSYLKRFRFDTLKIDQSFVRNMTSEVDDATIALAVIALAHNMRMTAVAEGVETEAQCRFLRLNRCDAMQGYFFSKPVPAAEMTAMLKSGKALGG